MSRVIIFTGKGGVGKTSIAAAHARKASKAGKKTLIVSTDMAHNLSDLFQLKIGRIETEIAPFLYALEIDPEYEMKHEFSFMMDALADMLKFGKDEDIEVEFDMIPGLDELFSLLKIYSIYRKEEYEIIIVDCAPTGETLSFLKFPELLSWYMEKLFPVGKVAMKIVRPISSALFKLQLPDTKAMNDIERLYLRMAELQNLLRDKEVCSIRLVTMPEKMVVEETKRNYMYLKLYNFNVDGLYINRILPKDIDNPFFTDWLSIQEKYLTELEDVFQALPIYPVKWYDLDLNGFDALDRLCGDALTDTELFLVKCREDTEIFEKTANGYLLNIHLPFIMKDDIIMHNTNKELIIKIGNFKRNIPLPQTLRSYEVTNAKLEDEFLKVDFSREEYK